MAQAQEAPYPTRSATESQRGAVLVCEGSVSTTELRVAVRAWIAKRADAAARRIARCVRAPGQAPFVLEMNGGGDTRSRDPELGCSDWESGRLRTP